MTDREEAWAAKFPDPPPGKTMRTSTDAELFDYWQRTREHRFEMGLPVDEAGAMDVWGAAIVAIYERQEEDL